MRSTVRLATIALLVLVSAGCAASSASSGSASVSSPSTDPTVAPSASPADATLLLRITSEGGFINPAATIAQLPTVVVYTDGRIFTPAPIPEIYPGPLVGGYMVRDVGPAGAAAIADALRAAGLDQPSTDDGGIAADTGTTVVTVVLDGQTQTTRIAGSGGVPGRPGTNPQMVVISELLDRLNDATDAWGSTATEPTAYVPDAYRIFVAPGAPPADANVPQQPAAWPLSTPLAEFGTPATPDRGISGLRSGVVIGDDAATLTPFLAQLNTLTPVTSDGEVYTLYVLPLLPDESAG
jgi:hypothetical protein